MTWARWARRADTIVAALGDAGVRPEDVDVVVNTHVDGVGLNIRPTPDGAGMVATFPHARYVFSSTELGLSADDERLDPLRRAGVIDPVDPPAEVAPGVTLEDAPGHRPGHLAVRLRSRGAEALVPGHLVISPVQVADPTIALDEDPGRATATRREVLADLADRGGVLIASLVGGPGGGRVAADGDTWRLEPVARTTIRRGGAVDLTADRAATRSTRPPPCPLPAHRRVSRPDVPTGTRRSSPAA